MARSPLSPGDRARGALLGLAAGHAAGLDRPRASSSRVGPYGRQDTDVSPYADVVARALLLGEELLEEPVDLERIAVRWVEWWRHDGRGTGPAATRALEHLAQWRSPLREPEATGDSAPLAICLPIALAAHGSPGNLVTGTYHTALIAGPDLAAAWAAVAVNVAAAQFFAGRRDFVADVIEALRANDADEEIVSVARRVPLLQAEDLDFQAAESSPVRCLEAALYAAYHDGSWERALNWTNEPGDATGTTAAVIGGLLGARDGERAIPAAWIEGLPDSGAIRDLAKRLVQPRDSRKGPA